VGLIKTKDQRKSIMRRMIVVVKKKEIKK